MSTYGFGYNRLKRLLEFGRERAFREDMLRLAALSPGESILDVGCGTGTLALAADRYIGRTGSIYGIDASPEMIERARAKARKRRMNVSFENAAAEALPFPDARFDAVFLTLMLHVLPRNVRRSAVDEIRRVLKPAGRVVIVEFEESGTRSGIAGHLFRRRHGHVRIEETLSVLNEAGLKITKSGPFRKRSLYFVIATSSDAQTSPD
jgi:ubiquinone/menaquinone biosynthesis C-methylase UbiE